MAFQGITAENRCIFMVIVLTPLTLFCNYLGSQYASQKRRERWGLMSVNLRSGKTWLTAGTDSLQEWVNHLGVSPAPQPRPGALLSSAISFRRHFQGAKLNVSITCCSVSSPTFHPHTRKCDLLVSLLVARLTKDQCDNVVWAGQT